MRAGQLIRVGERDGDFSPPMLECRFSMFRNSWLGQTQDILLAAHCLQPVGVATVVVREDHIQTAKSRD
jgi:hypothetical protein